MTVTLFYNTTLDARGKIYECLFQRQNFVDYVPHVGDTSKYFSSTAP